MSLSAPCIIHVDGELNAALRVVTSGRDTGLTDGDEIYAKRAETKRL